ncbi:MAG: glycerol-3-phosphate dehydrogenase/oxidase [Acidobacteria bacterium]|nr:glycerol-3-phosphate dehydrogenase/oxidase [Acidobacteriota bacterium]
MFPPGWRERALANTDDTYDVIVVGGGISGCGVALDAVQRGLRVLLLERGDIASGTSSRSSKLIHGGLRYLKQMQFRVTRLACRERDRLLALNPHLVDPIRFIYPAYEGSGTPGWQVDLGLWMYDKLTHRPERHEQLSPAEIQEMAPNLNVEGLDRALAYGDAMGDDARLTLAVAETAVAYGADVLTRCEVHEAIRNSRGRVHGVVAEDLESGRSLRIAAHAVVNAAGVWSDLIRERLGLTEHHLRPSRGIHLIIPPGVLSLNAALTIPSPDDGRPVFLIPHPEGDLLGTTDIYHDGSYDDPRPTDPEVDYLLRAVSTAFPHAGISREILKGAFAGLRPILDSHAEDPSEASREEGIWQEEGLLTVAGGKLTTWRSTAEETVDELLKMLPGDRSVGVSPCATEGTPLARLAPRDLGRQLETAYKLNHEVAAGMARRLGSLAWSACALARRGRDLEPLIDGLDLTPAETVAHLRWGAVLHLEDLLLRRARFGMWNPDAARELLPRLRPVFAKELGWRFSRWQSEVQRFEKALTGWTIEGIIHGGAS